MPTPLLDTMPPNSADAERSLIGCVLIDPRVMESVAWLPPEAFYHVGNQAIYAAIRAMHDAGEPIDLVLVVDRLRREAALEKAGGEAHLVACAQAVGATAHAVGYAKTIARHAKARRIIHAAADAIQRATDPTDDPDAVLDAIESELSAIRTRVDLRKPVSCQDAAVDAMTRIDRLMRTGEGSGLPTGLADVDDNFGGLFPGELTILAALPGIGKTAFALQVAAHNATHGRLVYFVSLEMEPIELSTRLACSESGISQHDVRRRRIDEHGFSALGEAFRRQSDSLLFHPAGDVTPSGLRREVRHLMKRDLRLLVVDYLQLVTPDPGDHSREQQVSRISRTLKQITRDHHIPVLCLSQFNRQVTDDFSRPSRRMLRESGAIEQDADAIWFLWKHKPTDGEPWNAYLGVDKNRNADTGDLKLTWLPRRTRFEPYSVAGYDEFNSYS